MMRPVFSPRWENPYRWSKDLARRTRRNMQGVRGIWIPVQTSGHLDATSLVRTEPFDEGNSIRGRRIRPWPPMSSIPRFAMAFSPGEVCRIWNFGTLGPSMTILDESNNKPAAGPPPPTPRVENEPEAKEGEEKPENRVIWRLGPGLSGAHKISRNAAVHFIT